MDIGRLDEVSHIVADLSARFVSHAGYKELETEFNRLLWRRRADISAGRTPEGRGLIVVGNSGSGKTTAVDRLTARHPQLNLGQDGSVKLEALSVRVPSPASLKFVGEKTLHGFGLKIERNKTSNWLWDKVQFHARKGVSETLCMRVSPCEFGGSFVEPFWVCLLYTSPSPRDRG